jgi:two-component system, LuxR family, response regulator DctR
MQVYVIDDEEALRDSLSWLLESRDLKCDCFASGESFLAALPVLPQDTASCIILDIRMGAGMSGIELFQRIPEVAHQWPVIFLSGHGDIALAVTAVKQGAFDFLEKPFADNQLVDRVFEAITLSRQRQTNASQSEVIRDRLNQLSTRELDVMEGILNGKANRDIALDLEMAVRTVEVHRASIFKKMGVKGAVELINLLQVLEV